jgi:hypothetical protein
MQAACGTTILGRQKTSQQPRGGTNEAVYSSFVPLSMVLQFLSVVRVKPHARIGVRGA